MVSFMLEYGTGLARGKLQATGESVEKEGAEECEDTMPKRSISSDEAGFVAMLGIFINASDVALLETRVV